MSKTFIIDVPPKMIDYLQRLSFELGNYRDNLAYLLDTRRNDVELLESEAFRRYQDLTDARQAEYELAKASVTAELIPAAVQSAKHSWEIDFRWLELRLTVYDEDSAEACRQAGLREFVDSAIEKRFAHRMIGGVYE